MAATRTSSRQAARKAKEAISGTNGTRSKAAAAAGAKRKGSIGKGPAPKREKKEDQKPKEEEKEDHVSPEQREKEQIEREEKEKEQKEQQQKERERKEVKEQEQEDKELQEKKIEEAKAGEPEEEDKMRVEEVEQRPVKVNGHDENATTPQEKPPDREPEAATTIESGIRKSEEREDIVPSNILEKGIIYFFFRPRVNVEEPHSVSEVARSFMVLRPTPKGAILGAEQGSVASDAHCRLMILPKKKFPTTGRERDMGFVEKAGISMKDLQETFIAGDKYETITRGERFRPEAKPYAEGVYAITSTKRASHLAYILTIPAEPGDIQEDFGLRHRGSWIIQSKNPKYPGPSYARLPKDPEYPDHVREKFADLRWIPMEPEFIDYPHAQFLMIGEAQEDLGKAATAEAGGKEPHQEQPGEELEKLEHENEERIEALEGDHTVYRDLGLDAQNYPKVPTTWTDQK